MFLKRIFRKHPPPEPRLEKFSLESLHERIVKLRVEKIENFKEQLDPIVDEIARLRMTLSDSLRELMSSEPDEEVHLGLLKSATEARKLLSEKVSRAISELVSPAEFSKEGLSAFDERVLKAVNLITDAMSTHGRYVRAVFVQKFSTFEFRLRELHGLIMRSHTAIERAIKEISALDSILAEIDLQIQLMQDAKKIAENIRFLESRAEDVRKLVQDESNQLTGLKSSKEFKSAEDSLKEIDRIQQEINKTKGMAVSRISEMGRPFRKIEKLVASGGHSIGHESIKMLKICINNPVEVISSDENIEALEKLLQETSELINTGKIDLNERERRSKLGVARSLASELRNLKKNLVSLSNQLKAQQIMAESPVIGQAVKIENLIAQHESELTGLRASIEELVKKSKSIDEELSSKRESLEKLASDIMGMKIELTF